MSSPPTPAPRPGLMSRAVRLSVSFDLDAATIGNAEPLHLHTVLATSALHLGDDEPNKAVAMLLGYALEAMCRNDDDQAVLALGATVHLLKGISESQNQGVTQ